MTNGQGWIQEARAALQNSETDFFVVNPGRYWTDFLLCLCLAYGAGTLFLLAPLGTIWQWLAYPLAVFWLYRLGSLVHEVCHLGHQEMRVFKVTWNLLVGVMTLSPSPFFTRHHRDHHSCKLFGTGEDPEYVASFSRLRGLSGLALYLFDIATFPPRVLLRFLLAPVTFLHPKLREWALRRGSSLTPNWRYERKLNNFDRFVVTGIELLCSVRAWMMLVAVCVGWTNWTRLPLVYAIAVGVLSLNQMRLLGDHHLYSNGERSSLEDHIRDSCNYVERDFGAWLLFPFAIRYHALHHMFPSLPYHNLPEAHLHLSRTLPADSPYHSLSQPSWWSVARRAFRIDASVPSV